MVGIQRFVRHPCAAISYSPIILIRNFSSRLWPTKNWNYDAIGIWPGTTGTRGGRAGSEWGDTRNSRDPLFAQFTPLRLLPSPSRLFDPDNVISCNTNRHGHFSPQDSHYFSEGKGTPVRPLRSGLRLFISSLPVRNAREGSCTRGRYPEENASYRSQ